MTTTIRRAKPVTAIALWAALALTATHPARADEPGPAAVDGDHRWDVAKHKYEQGVEAYREQRYADAVRLFLDADALRPSPALSYDIARAYEKIGDEAATLRWYRNYLRLDPRTRNRAEVEQSIAALSRALASKGIQQITLSSIPAGATVSVDGNAVGLTPLTVELVPGRHQAQLTARGYDDVQSSFELKALSPMDLVFTLEPTQSRKTEVLQARAAPTEGNHARRRFGIAPWVTIGAGALALVGSLAYELARRSAEDDARRETEQLSFQHDVEAMNDRQETARWLLGAGAVLVATGGTLLFFNDPVGPGSRAAVTAVPGGAALSMSRVF